MSKELPRLSPETQTKADQFHGACSELLDNYVHGFEMDFNRHAVKHGPMDETRAHYDITRLLTIQVQNGQLPMSMAMGILSEAIIRGVAKKRGGKG